LVPAPLSFAAERFLRSYVSSVLQLDALTLLHDDPERWWTTASIASQLHVGEPAAASALEALGRANVLDVRLGAHLSYRYAPVDAHLARTIDEIADAHYRGRDALVACIGG
jgi:hypothetical protein